MTRIFSTLVLTVTTIVGAFFVPSATDAGLVSFGMTGFSGGDTYTSGDFTQLTNGLGITKSDPLDPSTWINTSHDYQHEWYDHHLSGASNSKIGWLSLDLGSSMTNLESLYLFNSNYQNQGNIGTSTFNIYYADSPTVALPSPPGNNGSLDYDFSSGGWTQFGSTKLLAKKATGVYDLSSISSARYIAVEMLTGHSTSDLRSGFDEVAITALAVVPEPQSVALASFGVLGLVGLAWRRRRR